MAMHSWREFQTHTDNGTTGDDMSVTISNSNQLLPVSVNKVPDAVYNGLDHPISQITQPVCQWILYQDINNSKVRIWDVLILVPNALFMAFLLGRLRPSVRRLQASNSPVFTTFYGLVFLVSFIGVLRCIISMTVNASQEAGEITDKMLWLILRFFLLTTEASVITFGFYFGRLDSQTSTRRVLACASFFSFGYSAIQGTLELKYPHEAYSVGNGENNTDNFDLFAHGGMIFLGTSSSFFYLAYLVILILPLTRIKEKLVLPSKRSFYYYVATLAVLNLIQTVGSWLLYQHVDEALCVVDVTTYLYFTLFAPLVYIIFLRRFFRSQQSGSLLFSYSHQDEDVRHNSQVSLPSHAAQRDSDLCSTGFDQIKSSVAVEASPPTRLPSPFLSINKDWNLVPD